MSQPTTLAPLFNSSNTCTLCPNGYLFSFPNKDINIPGFEFVKDCQSLSNLLTLFTEESSECNLVQSISSFCGCPKQEDACNLCPDGSTAVYGWRDMEFLTDVLHGMNPTCELLEAGLHSYKKNDSFCQISQRVFGDYCGCGAKEGSEPLIVEEVQQCNMCKFERNTSTPDKEIDIEGFPLRTCGQLELAAKALLTSEQDGCKLIQNLDTYCGCADPLPESEACPICGADNSFQVPLPEKVLDSSLTDIFAPGVSIKCSVLSDIVRSHPNREFAPYDGGKCAAFQGLGTECGCPIPEDGVGSRLCSRPLDPEVYNYSPIVHDEYSKVTCRFVDLAAPFLRNGDRLVFDDESFQLDTRFFKMLGYLCGCNNGVLIYWGADTTSKQALAVWLQRITAILSLFGSLLMIVFILIKKKLQKTSRSQMYFRLILALSFADILSSVAWGLGPLPTKFDSSSFWGANVNVSFADDKQINFYEAHGNKATCKLQGFLLHLGFTSIFYNAALAYYFKLTIVNGLRESNINVKYRILLLWIPAILGTIIALAAIPFITFTPVGCTIGSHHDFGGWIKLILLFYLPYGSAFILTPWNTFSLYQHVQLQGKKGDRWRISTVTQRQSKIPSTNSETESSSNLTFREKVKNHCIQIIRRKKSNSSSRIARDVSLQSIFYLLAFLASYTIFFVAFAVDGYEMNSYPLYIALSILTPIQGFLNFIVFFRVKIALWIGKLWERLSGIQIPGLRQNPCSCFYNLIRFQDSANSSERREVIVSSNISQTPGSVGKGVEKSMDTMSDGD